MRRTSLSRRLMTWLLIAWVPIAPLGCSRVFWRQQADRDSYEAITENLDDPRWAVPRIDVTPDPRSRFFSPYDPDYPPLPPDDPAAHVYMHWVDGWSGYKSWHEFGDLISVENPQWLEPFKFRAESIDPETGAYLEPLPEIENLTLGDAIELSLIHSREYQFALEQLFLAALAVTFERFQFGVRYLGFGGVPGADSLTVWSPHGGPDSSSLDSRFGISQLLPTGGQWIVELTNNTLWLFAGENSTQTASTLSFSLVQPLLFGAGRKVVLENLTQRERELLYAVRDLARFRKEFFTGIVSSYLNLLQQVQTIRNTEANIFRLQEQVEALQAVASQRPEAMREPLGALPAGLTFPPDLADSVEYDAENGELIWYGPMTDAQRDRLLGLSDDPDFQEAAGELAQRITTQTVTLDVLDLQSTLASTVNQLREQQRVLQDRLDAFKIQMGLRTDFLVTIDDSLLVPFQFIDPALTDLEQEIRDFIAVWGELSLDEPDPADVLFVAQQFQTLLHSGAETTLRLLEEDARRVNANLDERLASLASEEARNYVRNNLQRDQRFLADGRSVLNDIIMQTDQLVEKLQNPDVPFQEVRDAVVNIKTYQEDFLKTVQSLYLVQIGFRVEMISLQPFRMAMEAAVAVGLANRLDLMNVKAQVMDARREVEVAANELQSLLDVEVSGDFRTPTGTDVFDFRGDISDLRVGLAFDAPMDLIAERNNYRTALINYQRAKRDYMLFEDQVKQQIRADWRQLAVLRQNVETQRQAIRIAAAQFDSAVEDANAPPVPGQQRGGTSGLQGRNLSNALQNVLRAQNSMIAIWVDYETNRLNIYRDMGIMDIGPDGVWNDPYYREQAPSLPTSAPESSRLNGPDDAHDQLRQPHANQGSLDGQPLWQLDDAAGRSRLSDRRGRGGDRGAAHVAAEPDR